MTGWADVIVSICPPESALQVAHQVQAADFSGQYVDANAVAPATARQMAQHFAQRYVDGGLIGPPARQPGTTRLYLSGPAAADIAALFSAGYLEAVVVDQDIDSASALKMAYAAYTKGASALLLAVNALAKANGVHRQLQQEWAISQPNLVQRSDHTAAGVAPKAWRFAGEMAEIADTFAEQDLPDGFHRAAQQLYTTLAGLKDQQDVNLQAVLDLLVPDSPTSHR